MNKHIVSSAGLYYVCYRLSQHGWNAIPTIKNAEGADIFAQHIESKKKITLQVKTEDARRDIYIGLSREIEEDYWIIVHLINEETTAYILSKNDILRKLVIPAKTDPVQFWILCRARKNTPDQPHYARDRYRERWDLVS